MFVTVSLPGLILLGVGRPTRRGFFCDDESIRYPYNDTDTISSTVVAIVCITATSSTVSRVIPDSVLQFPSTFRLGQADNDMMQFRFDSIFLNYPSRPL